MPMCSFWSLIATSTHSTPSIIDVRVDERAWRWGHYNCHCKYGSPDYEGDSRDMSRDYTFILGKSPSPHSFYFPHTFAFSLPLSYMIISIEDNVQLECGGRVCIYLRWWSWCSIMHIALSSWFLVCWFFFSFITNFFMNFPYLFKFLD